MRIFFPAVAAWALLAASAPDLAALNIQTGFRSGFIDPEINAVRILPQPDIASKGVVLVEETTGTVLFQQGADEPIPPASLTKLVVMDLALDHLARTGTPKDAVVTISSRAWAVNAPARSSLMFLGPNQTVTWQDLLLGLAVDSGNDAAVAIAENVAGSVEDFVRLMNERCAMLGMKHTSFVEPSGYSELNMTTAREFAFFVWRYLRDWPQALAEYHSVSTFTWPRAVGQDEIVQYNRNRLLTTYPGADGLKTGYIDESGYNLAFTAARDGMRLIGVILGGPSDLKRFSDARSLLDYGFGNYALARLPIPAMAPIRIWGGDRTWLRMAPPGVQAVLPYRMIGSLRPSVRQASDILAPLSSDRIIAWSSWTDASGLDILRFPVNAGMPVGVADPLAGAGEWAYLGLRGLAGFPPPLDTDLPAAEQPRP